MKVSQSALSFCRILIIFITVLLFNILTNVEGDDCRIIQFKEEINHMILANNVVKSYRVTNQEICKINCYMEPKCVSYNYGPLEDGSFLCELNEKHHLQVPSNEFTARDGYIYSRILTYCESNPCVSNATCEEGFGAEGYRCICPEGYYGDKCQLVAFQCPLSWAAFNKSCYKLFKEEKTWTDAKAICNTNNAQLVNIGTEDENNFILRELLKEKNDYWIGLTDLETEDVWKWTSGAILSGYINWVPKQPNNYNEQDCAAITNKTQHASGKWHDDSCSNNRGFICELIW